MVEYGRSRRIREQFLRRESEQRCGRGPARRTTGGRAQTGCAWRRQNSHASGWCASLLASTLYQDVLCRDLFGSCFGSPSARCQERCSSSSLCIMCTSDVEAATPTLQDIACTLQMHLRRIDCHAGSAVTSAPASNAFFFVGDDIISQRDIEQATAQASDSATVSASSRDEARGAGRRRAASTCALQRCDDTAASQERPVAVPPARPAATSAPAHTPQRQPSAFTLTSAAQAAGVWNPEAQLPLMQRLPTMSSASGSEPAATTGEEPQPLPLSAGPPAGPGPPSSPPSTPTASGPGAARAQHSPPPPGVPQPLPAQANTLHDLTVLDVLTLATARAGQQTVVSLAAASQQSGALPQCHAAADAPADSPLTALLRAHLLASQHQDAAAAASAMVRLPPTPPPQPPSPVLSTGTDAPCIRASQTHWACCAGHDADGPLDVLGGNPCRACRQRHRGASRYPATDVSRSPGCTHHPRGPCRRPGGKATATAECMGRGATRARPHRRPGCCAASAG